MFEPAQKSRHRCLDAPFEFFTLGGLVPATLVINDPSAARVELVASSTPAAPDRPPHRHGKSFRAIARLSLTIALASCADMTLAQTSGPLAAYSFDASSGTALADVSGNNNTITLFNGPSWSAGRYGNALSFDGSNDRGVAAAYNPALNLTEIGRAHV